MKATMAATDSHDYVLRGGDRGAERLSLLAAVKWPTTQPLLERVGLRPGLHCLDVGCGIGTVTLRMAEAVQPTGKVTGIDFDEHSLKLARRAAEQLGLEVEFKAACASRLQDMSSYDLVFGRFLLTHLADAEQALAGMARAARPGGTVVVEDIEFTGHFSYPACSAFDRYVSLYQEVVRHKGGDPNIGPRLVGMFLDAGLTDVEVEVIQPTYRRGMGKQMAAVTMEHIREAVIGAGLASQDEINAVIAEISAFADDPRTLLSLPRIFQVWGKRPH